MQLPSGGVTITAHMGMHASQPRYEEYQWYGGPIMWASFQYLTSVPNIGDTIRIGPYHVKCIDRDDVTEVVVLERNG